MNATNALLTVYALEVVLARLELSSFWYGSARGGGDGGKHRGIRNRYTIACPIAGAANTFPVLYCRGLRPRLRCATQLAYANKLATRPGNPLRYLWRTTANREPSENSKNKPIEGGENGNHLTRLSETSHWLDLNNTACHLDVRGVRIELFGVNDPHSGRDNYVDFEPARLGVRGAGAGGVGADLATGTTGAKSGYSNEYLRATGQTVQIGLAHTSYARVLDRFLTDGADLVLCGHTHGGQVCLPGGRALVTNCDLDSAYAAGVF